MFSYVPFPSDHQPYLRSRQNLYARQLARERERAQYAAALRGQRARELAQAQASQFSPHLYPDYDDDDLGFRYGHGFSQRKNAYLEAKQRQEAAENARRMLLAEEKRRGQESYLRALDEARQRSEEIEQEMREESGEKQTAGTPAAAMPVPPNTPQTSSAPSTPLTHGPSSLPTTPEELDSAAQTIQTFFRQRKSITSIKAISERFNHLKQRFHFPSTVDFILASGQIVSVDVATIESEPSSNPETDTTSKLAYSSNNAPIHMYNEELSRLLVSLDAIESWGAKSVRDQRREAVRRIETEAGRVESMYERIWNEYTKAQAQKDEKVGTTEANADITEEVLGVDAKVAQESEQMEDVEVTKAETEKVEGDHAEVAKEDMEQMAEVEVRMEEADDKAAKEETDQTDEAEANKEEFEKVEAFDADTPKAEAVKVTQEVVLEATAELSGEDDTDMAEVEVVLATDVEASSLEAGGEWTLVTTPEGPLQAVDSSQ